MPRALPVILVLALVAVPGCGQRPTTPSEADTEPAVADDPSVLAVVTEAWVAELSPADNLDSVAIADDLGWVVATTKESDQLVVLDAATGGLVRRVGGPGAVLGGFSRPNGVAIAGELVLVVERDNSRVQVLRLPEFEPLGAFGAGELERPYGIALNPLDDGALDVYVTDNFALEPTDPGADPGLARRVMQYRLRLRDGTLSTTLVRSFGEVGGPGALLKVESIAVDAVHDRLLIADESRLELAIYSLDGRFDGRTVGAGLISAEPEGIGLWACGDDGYWVVTDQHEPRSRFLVLDRATLEPVGSFQGAVTANTDGIAVTGPLGAAFPAGAVLAAHDDRGVAAFDWREVAAALAIETDCPTARQETGLSRPGGLY